MVNRSPHRPAALDHDEHVPTYKRGVITRVEIALDIVPAKTVAVSAIYLGRIDQAFNWSCSHFRHGKHHEEFVVQPFDAGNARQLVRFESVSNLPGEFFYPFFIVFPLRKFDSNGLSIRGVADVDAITTGQIRVDNDTRVVYVSPFHRTYQV